jgi:membrane fusion protein
VAGQPLASLVPAASALEAHLLVPSRAIGFLREGQPVRLRLHAFPYQKFGQLTGVVQQVPGSPAKPDELSAAAVVAVSAAEALYRVKVRLDDTAMRAYGQAQPLRAGMSLDATVVLETRRLYEWILDPLYAITGRI